MKLYPRVVLYLLLVMLLSASCVGWCRLPVQDGDVGTIGACLAQPDGSRVTLLCEEVLMVGKSGKSFAIKEWFEPQPKQPRLAIVSTSPLPVKEYWSVDVTGILSTYSGISRSGREITQRILIVSPENVTVYCSRNGKPLMFLPIKGLDIDWPYKRTLADLANDGLVDTASVSTTDEGSLPPMPDFLDSASEPIYCATIADARAQYSETERILVELQCRPFSAATSTQFILGQDNPTDSITVYYTNSAILGTGRINKIVGTIQKDINNNYWIEVDSGPNWTEGDFVGSVQAVVEGSIAWAKTFADATTLPAPLSGKVVSRTFPSLGYFYIQETNRSNGIRVVDSGVASSLNPGDIVTIHEGEITTVDGERVINSTNTEFISLGTPPASLGLNNKALGGGSYNVLTSGPVGGFGLNNVGLLIRAWGKVTDVDFGGFYIDDGSNVTDGGIASGVRVVGFTGYQTYTPVVGDYVAVIGISGLATYNVEYGLARTIRIASSNDLTVMKYSGPPTEVEVQPTGIDTNGYGKLTIYWKAVPDAIGYNIYRGTVSGGQDYQNPINGSTPWNTSSYPGSDKLAFTDTGLTLGQEYFYTVKAVRADGESIASEEDSDIPDYWAIPWDSDDAYAITNAVANLYGYYADLICAVGPDGTVYSNWQGVLRPGGSVDLGTLEPGTNILRYSDGSTLNLPDDGGILSGEDIEEEEEGMGILAAIPTTQQNASDGPYRRVRSKSTCTGSYGVFYPGWRNQIYMAKDPNRNIDDDYWTYLGSRTIIGSGKQRTHFEVDAGVQWSEVYYRYNPYLSLKYKRYNGSKARTLAPKNCPITFDTSYFGGIEMCYAFQPTGKSSTPMILFYGADQNWEEKTVLLAAANPVKVKSGMMKRAHSIAQGRKGGNFYRRTGSHVYNAAFSNGMLRDAFGQWVTWTGDLTQDQGAYPWPSSIVTWTIPSGQEYYKENGINIQL